MTKGDLPRYRCCPRGRSSLRGSGSPARLETARQPGSEWHARAGQLCSYEADLPCEQLVHHALLQLTRFGELSLQFGDFRIYVGKDGSDGDLFGKWRPRYRKLLQVAAVQVVDC